MERIYALYSNFEDAASAVNDLVNNSGFGSDQISMITRDPDGRYGKYVDASGDDVHGGDGAGFGAVVGTLVGLSIATIPGLGPIFAAGPFAAALIGGVGAATGAATGAVTAAMVDLGHSEADAAVYENVLSRGGALVTAEVDEAWEERVEAVMSKYNPLDITEYDMGTDPF